MQTVIYLDCMDVFAFEWTSQLRFYWDKKTNDVIVKQTNAKELYGYEYVGNSGRLVITPLTDRCYITLTTAMHMNLGGYLRGSSYTGKTETVKDLAKHLAQCVIVVNCSECLDYKSMSRIFLGRNINVIHAVRVILHFYNIFHSFSFLSTADSIEIKITCTDLNLVFVLRRYCTTRCLGLFRWNT